MKLCVFAGTFNPIHYGHLKMAEYVLQNFDIKKVLFIPAYIPPFKELSIDMAQHRLKMVKLAIKHNKNFELSDIEFKMGGISYTYLTINELYKLYEVDGNINFIIGTDALKNLDKWYESEKLKKILDFIVFAREEDFQESNYKKLKSNGYNIQFAKMEFNDISSTDIRNKISEGKSINNLTPAEVEGYIKNNGLYKSERK